MGGPGLCFLGTSVALFRLRTHVHFLPDLTVEVDQAFGTQAMRELGGGLPE